MQGFGFNGVVSERKPRLPQENFTLPPPLDDVLKDLWRRIGKMRKWEAYVAAILAFYRRTDEEQYAAMDAVAAARRRKDFRHLLIRDVGESGDNGGGATPPNQSPAQAAKAEAPVTVPKRGRARRVAPPREQSH